MGFDCKFCGEREIWAFESPTHPQVCWDCHRARYPETNEMRKHRECQGNANTPITINMNLNICKVSTQAKALQNVAWINPNVDIHPLIIDNTEYPVFHDETIPIDAIAINFVMRRNHNLSIGQSISY